MIVVRETGLGDPPQVAACIGQVARERRYIAATSGYSDDETRGFIQFLQENGGIHMVLEDSGTVVGWCDVTPGVFEGLTHVGHLGMGLLPAYRGQGWGEKLLQETLSASFNGCFERVELEVFASNHAAIALYRRLGFKQEGLKINARKLDGQYDDFLTFGMLQQDWQRQPGDYRTARQTSDTSPGPR